MEYIALSKIENVDLIVKNSPLFVIPGRLHVSINYLSFFSEELSKVIRININIIKSVKFTSINDNKNIFHVKLKDFRRFEFKIEIIKICESLKQILTYLTEHIDQYNKLPCLLSNYDYRDQATGWIHPKNRLEQSFQRMGLPNDQWQYSDINENYQISDSYPSVIFIPQGISKSRVQGSANYRSRNRFPALTYYYAAKGSALCRCSQPFTGFGKKCNDDIALLKRIKDVALKENTNVLHVLDARPKLNALTNRAIGMGYEITRFYENIDYEFLQIENVHVMRSSLKKLLKKYENLEERNNFSAENSEWSRHIKLLLKSSLYIVKKLKRGENVVVHCSDGWDRTSQLCALAQIIIDPYYRTVEGFEDIIEKDFLAFGHNFKKRCNQLSNAKKSDTSPIFIQFLDCVYQLMIIYPDQFQFNELMLRHLHRWSQDCSFGTFIGSSEKERLALKVHQNCHSVWGYIRHSILDYLNQNYNKNNIIPVINNPIVASKFVFWKYVYYPEVQINVQSPSIYDYENKTEIENIESADNFDNSNISRPTAKKKHNEENSEKVASPKGPDKKRFSFFKFGFFSGLVKKTKKSINALKSKSMISETNKPKLSEHDNKSMSLMNLNNREIRKSIIQDLEHQIHHGNFDSSKVKLENKCINCETVIRKMSETYFCSNCFDYLCLSCFKEYYHSCVYCSLPVCRNCLMNKKQYTSIKT